MKKTTTIIIIIKMIIPTTTTTTIPKKIPAQRHTKRGWYSLRHVCILERRHLPSFVKVLRMTVIIIIIIIISTNVIFIIKNRHIVKDNDE